MTPFVSLRAFTSPPSAPPLVLVDMRQEDLAKPRLLALSGADAAVVNSRKVLDHARWIGPSMAFRRTIGESVFFKRATSFIRRTEGFEPHRSEMIFERGSPSCYSRKPHVIAQFRRYLVFTLMRVIRPSGSAATTLQRLSYGKQANGMSAGG
jgi:hypothetical protein